MAAPIVFYFDFASPYAYFASGRIGDLGVEFGRAVEWRPILVWAIIKAHGIAPPMDRPVKRAYFLNDMKRSAAFHGVPYREPVKLPLSSHLAARLYYAVGEDSPEMAAAFARRAFSAFFVERLDISDETVLVGLAADVGITADHAESGMKGQTGRAMLAKAVDDAVAAGVVGSPYFLVDGEGFFGVDRIPQLRWFLSGGR